MSNSEKNTVNSGNSLQDLVNDSVTELSAEEACFVPKVNIRKKQKNENLRTIGARIPVFMIEELKLLADYHEANVEDLLAGVLEDLLNASMDEVYAKMERDLKKRRRERRA